MRSTRDILEAFIQQQRAEGRVEEARQAVTRLLTRRFEPPPGDVVATIASTHDLQLLRAWHDLAITAPVSEVLADIRAHTQH